MKHVTNCNICGAEIAYFPEEDKKDDPRYVIDLQNVGLYHDYLGDSGKWSMIWTCKECGDELMIHAAEMKKTKMVQPTEENTNENITDIKNNTSNF